MTAIDRRIVTKILGLYPYQNLYFSQMKSMSPTPIFKDAAPKTIKRGHPAIAMSGIGNPKEFNSGVAERFKMVDEIIYPDHHTYRTKDLEHIAGKLKNAPEETVIITTEKDAVKFMNSKKVPQYLKEKLFYQPIKVVFHDDTQDDFFNKLSDDVKTNPKDRVLRT